MRNLSHSGCGYGYKIGLVLLEIIDIFKLFLYLLTGEINCVARLDL